MLEKTFDPRAVEPRLYEAWETSGVFSPDATLAKDPNATTYSIVIPPPNVTGSLHIGHALNNTLQDILARYHRMKGEAVLWLPGTDHAGIATQMVVERQLAAQGNVSRRDMGRDAFLETVWKWKAESGGTIVRQLRRLGASCDWSRERFTLDDGLSAAVRKVFVDLYKQGLIYRDKRLVNWDPHFQTAISDLEVEQKEVDGAYWHFAYPLADGVTYEHPIAFDDEGKATEWETRDYIVVATTRPETMLGDTGVAVHPDDARYASLVGKFIDHPITGRRIKIVADDYADPAKGSGAVKITPAHDFNDFGVGKRQGLEALNVMDAFGRITAADTPDVPAEYEGMDRFAARKAIVARAEDEGWLKEVEKTRHMVPHGDRSGVVIEPWLTDQWWVDAWTLAQPAIEAVEDGATVFEPKSYEKIYFEWLRNIEPWCISRQLWWGHRIPAWYGPNGEIYVAENEEDAREQALSDYDHEVELTQDEDVLDTWFSSALWPFSTLGWPDQTEDLKRFYPTNDLVTGFDIIFFWVARMMMMGVHFTGEVPFERVVINGLVRDEKGQKMSKSKGNVIDPLEIVDELGADALRLTMAMLSGTRDIKLSKQRIEGYRNFGTKLWNAARFCQVNECRRVEGFDPEAVQSTINRWIRGELARVTREVSQALDAARFDEASQAVYRFVWNVFCDWWLELAKPTLNGTDIAARDETRAMGAWLLDQCCLLLHPFMPFITEELWDQLAQFGGPARQSMLISAAWPETSDVWIDATADQEIGWLIEVVSGIRSLKAEANLPASAKPDVAVVDAGDQTRARIDTHRAAIQTLGRVGTVAPAGEAPKGSAPFVVGEATWAMAVAEFIDIPAETARLTKEIAQIDKDLEVTRKKLGNPDFVARAKAEVVEENRQRLTDGEAARAKLEAALERLKAAGVKTRLDKRLVDLGLFDSRAKAQAAIASGGVTVDGQPARAASQSVADAAVIAATEAHPWVGRGALKLVAALDLWPVEVAGRIVLDVGASTGGFTEVALSRGAARVYAVDVGRDQLHPRIADDPRVVNLQATDARALDSNLIPEPSGLIVTDLSFISLTKALGPALGLAGEGADLIALVKPQFEQESRADIGKGGIVTDPEARQAALEKVSAWLEAQGWRVRESDESPVVGGDGNREWLLWARLV